jgi:hypothetical protein
VEGEGEVCAAAGGSAALWGVMGVSGLGNRQTLSLFRYFRKDTRSLGIRQHTGLMRITGEFT